MSQENFRLDREIDAAKLLRTSLADILEGDEQLTADTLEGQTSINEAIQAAVDLYCRDQCACNAIAEHIKLLEARKARLTKRMGVTRALVAVALDTAGRKTVETPLGTATLKNVAPKILVDPDHEHEIPAEFWSRGDPVLDKKKLKEALVDGQTIPGARLDNGNFTVAFVIR